MIKGVQKYLELEITFKFHTLVLLDQSVWLASPWIHFWLNNICGVSMPLIHTYPKLHSKPLEIGWKEGKLIPWWGPYTLSDWANHLRNLYFIFAKLIKPPDRRLIKEWMIGNSFKTVLSCNHLRLGKAISPTGIKLNGWIECQTYIKLWKDTLL